MPKRSGLPRYVIADRARDGSIRLIYRAPGKPKITLPGPVGSDAFWKALMEAKEGRRAQKAGGGTAFRQSHPEGSFAWLIEEFYRSGDFLEGDKLTQADKRLVFRSVLAEPIAPDDEITFGQVKAKNLEPRHIEILRDRKVATPNAANKRLSYLGKMFQWAKRMGHVSINPAREVPRLKVPKKGFHSWTTEEVRQFEAHYPVGTKARLALSICLFTGVRLSDLAQMGRQHIRSGWLRMPQHKNRRSMAKVIEVPILPELQQIMDASPMGEMTLLVTDQKNPRPYSIKGLGNKMKEWCEEAGLPHCSTHGLRKAGAVIAAENGATESQLMAIYGWEDSEEAVLYTRAVRRRKMAGEAMHLLVPQDQNEIKIVPQNPEVQNRGTKRVKKA